MVARAVLAIVLSSFSAAVLAADVLFHWFEYSGQDDVFAEPLAEGEFQNPVLAGFYPDPSITRVGNTYYVVNSSYGYAPGIPIHKSTDLVHWQPLGHVLTRPSQLNLMGKTVSQGIFAPTIRYINGTFFVVATAVDAGGTFVVTTQDPAGEWSDPVWLPQIDGIHPDLFFDDNGKAYIAYSGMPEGKPLYNGHRAIWLWEFDLKTKTVVKDTARVLVDGGADITQKPIWVEGPHLYKHDGWYYLICAEGGTGDWHSEVVFRTKSLQSLFEPFIDNPTLSQRQQPAERPNPIASVGHADLIQTEQGEWWAVFLGTRNYEQSHFNTGRETFLLPVSWRDGWPVILAEGELVPYRLNAPANLLPAGESTASTGNFVWRDEFTGETLRPAWNMLRSVAPVYRLISGGGIAIEPRSVKLTSMEQPSFLARRQQHLRFSVKTKLQIPGTKKILAGLAVFQNERAHYYFAVQRTASGAELRLEKTDKSETQVVAKSQLSLPEGVKNITLGIDGDKGAISFYWQNSGGEKSYLSKDENAKMLSTTSAGGYVGVYLGLHVRNINPQ